MAQRIGGKLHLKVNGEVMLAKGAFSWNLGGFEREEVMGQDTLHGYTERPVPGYIEGEITDDGSLDMKALKSVTDATITLELANGKTISLTEAFAAGEWTGNSEEGGVPVRFVGNAEEII